MASETMTVQEAIAVVSDMLTNHLRTPDDIAIETLLAHARATTADDGEYSIEELPSAWLREKVFVLYRGRDEQHHGLNLCQLSDFDAHGEQTRALIVDALNARAALAPQGDRAQMFVCGGTPTPEMQKELDDFATYLRVKGRIDAQQKLAPQGVTVTEAMVEVACAAFSREWYEDVEARPMRVALTAALAASARGNL